ncbi:MULTISPECIES: deoxyribose-phosphate aldolase [Idiomarina]|uniref:deoxyribose-phosphate aldolase n=1 Tax=Idiomarina TaxID=135575 RepID=UPI00129A382B|nr:MULTISPECIES: deoxyribose-phosphate aldolase [Idiomarina]MRJ41760.1 deoxyribose-phosphate aldolase [Idiomarina sp. FeN1]NCU57750.1 deoxyribose-phosphate aldolase [Idiomarina sp. FenA--70]NCU60302.1 deoxyribose-phosphate aldolase [Idiomarina sp. FenBw--71]UUN13860.1 deoxyribose-phosphate aldolase [Idiomarina loihiensis]
MMTAQQAAQRGIALMDLTTLNNSDDVATITRLCESARTDFGHPAALCVFPELVVWTKLELERLGLTAIKVATVTNFPEGHANVERAVAETERAVAVGADEVDVVFPWRALQAGDSDLGFALVQSVKRACGEVPLKVIIESGELKTPELIKQASEIAIAAGADFIKTSTGKVPVNATLEAAEVMLTAIKNSGQQVGFKAAGGVRSAADVAAYLTLAEQIMGADWVTAEHFRFGASSLLGNLVGTLTGGSSPAEIKGY